MPEQRSRVLQLVAGRVAGLDATQLTLVEEGRARVASVPDRPNCRFRLTTRLGSEAASTDREATTFLRIVHLVVEAHRTLQSTSGHVERSHH